MEENYSTIRAIIGDFIGKKIIDITQHDSEEWGNDHESYVYLHFEDGRTLKFPIGEDGFAVETPN